MKYLILGAGPSGLTIANCLLQEGETSFLILEKESVAGGLCRSVICDQSPLDIGGGHFLDVRRPEVNHFLFSFMEENEWNMYERDSRISICGNTISHPFEANIWQMKLEDQIEYLKSIAVSGCNLGDKMPDKFVEWIYWKFGKRIADDYMIPYNQKMFGKELNQLGTYWLDKLPDVSFEETLLSCLTRKPYGTQPGHAQFYYPKKYGYGEVWKRMAETIKNNIEYNKNVKSIDFETKTVTTEDGVRYSAQVIVTTIPWLEFEDMNGFPENLKTSLRELKYSSVQIEYFPENLDTKAHWIYYPSPELSYHRILVRHNFCPGGRGYWTETNSGRICSENMEGHYRHMNKYAYPLNTIRKNEIMADILAWSRSRQVVGLGRWGEWQHYNSDVTVAKAMSLYKEMKNTPYL